MLTAVKERIYPILQVVVVSIVAEIGALNANCCGASLNVFNDSLYLIMSF